MGHLDSELIRLLHGELPPAEAKAISLRLAREPALLADYRRLESVWTALGADTAAMPRPGLAGAVVARARSAAVDSAGLEWSFAPAWAKVAAILALLVGAALGSGLALSGGAASSARDPRPESEAVLSSPLTLAESYETALQSPAPAGSDGDQEVRP